VARQQRFLDRMVQPYTDEDVNSWQTMVATATLGWLMDLINKLTVCAAFALLYLKSHNIIFFTVQFTIIFLMAMQYSFVIARGVSFIFLGNTNLGTAGKLVMIVLMTGIVGAMSFAASLLAHTVAAIDFASD